MTMAQHKVWRALVPLFVFLLVGGGVFAVTPQPAAANGISISNGSGPNSRPSMNVSPDSSRVCVAWSTFNGGAESYVRLYNTANDSWSPPLSQQAFQVSRDAGGDSRGTTRCAIDGAGRTHVVWTDNAGERLRYSMLGANADAGNSANWSQPVTVGSVRDAQHPDVVSIFADANGSVWLAYWSIDAGVNVYVKQWTPAGGWGGDVKVSNNGGKHPRIAGDNAGYIHVIYQQAGAGIRYTYRDVATGTWSASVQLPGSGQAIEYTGLAVDRDSGDVHAVYSTPTAGTDDSRVVRYVKKTGPTGTAFTNFVNLTGEANHVVPRLAWSASGKLTMVTDNRTDGTIEIATSTNNGANWSGANRVADAPGEGWPAVTMDAAGNSYIAYWKKDAGDAIFFLRLGNAPNTGGSPSPAPSATPSPSPSPSPSPTPPPAPAISNLTTTANTLTSHTINWTTTTPTSSRVFFSDRPDVPIGCTDSSCTDGDPALVTEGHAVTLRDLKPGTQYFFRVRSTDAFGQEVFSTTDSFTTRRLEIVGTGRTFDGRFSALVAAPVGTNKVEWSDDGIDWRLIFDGSATTTTDTIFAFGGDVTPGSETAEKFLTIRVRFNGGQLPLLPTASLDNDAVFQQGFSDINTAGQGFVASITQLDGREIVRGSDGQFRPLDTINRAEAAAIIARTFGWTNEFGVGAFGDQGAIDDQLWDDVEVLNEYLIARGFPDGTYNPTGAVTQGQIISLVTRAMVEKGYWTYAQDDPNAFPGAQVAPADRIDLLTYYQNIRQLTEFFPASGATYTAAAQRQFVARIVWEVIGSLEFRASGAAIYNIP